MTLTQKTTTATVEAAVATTFKVGDRVLTGKGEGAITAYSRGWFAVTLDSGESVAFRGKNLAPAPPRFQKDALNKDTQVARDVRREKRIADANLAGGPECACGCGNRVKPRRVFCQGHDARFHGWMRRIARGELEAGEIPARAAQLMTIIDGVPTTDYDGSPWFC